MLEKEVLQFARNQAVEFEEQAIVTAEKFELVEAPLRSSSPFRTRSLFWSSQVPRSFRNSGSATALRKALRNKKRGGAGAINQKNVA